MVNASIAKLHHYRTGFLSHKFCSTTNESVEDKSLWRWQKEIIGESTLAMKTLKIV